ncbi:MAG TPA: SDR family NAD(P)-dependent oxidoreductase [Vicinamibacterales bacterium]|nr:SDR family NAD(P)-dependent oxidoreductase [Vicinamibacterales bacterium]
MTGRVFEGRTVLITGAAKGIGRATAEQFVDAGAQVALLDRDAEALAAACAALAPRGPVRALQADVSVASDVENAVASCVAAFGGLDILVNNAAVHFARAIDRYTADEIDLLLAVNLKGALHAVRSCVAALRRSKGNIVSVSSMTGVVGQANGAVYVATKGALIALTKGLALELGADGIRVNCVCPAGVDTPLMRGWAETMPDPAGVLRGQAAMHLMNRMATPDEIAAAILFLASPAASFITGIALPVEGGATLGYRRA